MGGTPNIDQETTPDNYQSYRLALTWILFLFIFSIAEAPIQFATIWLREQAGFSQILVGVYVTLHMGVSVISLFFLDRWLLRSGYRRILIVASCTLIILYPIWILVPSPAARFLLAVPINYLFTVYWPIARAQSLASVPGRGGTITAVDSLFALVPIPLLFGLLAESITLTRAMLLVTMSGLVAILVLTWILPGSSDAEAGAGAGA